ncbi:RNA polymerase Rpc34 [Lophiostoma macrostomum CBS 122681]|uniref:DNA-directed RNA polymerase III subunit RPC6 n=1 Tax=Lophiostoma macrostomum CBS 122681 TaxID=1314788 RepID=A0A6A6T3K9_9PLEO|nr:RNA polymerase Rpc34 [Lophiostoma macrostomum CBS 122681]
MATTSAKAPPPEVKMEDAEALQAPVSDIGPRRERLYDKCAEATEGTVFFQRDLSNMDIAESVTDLLRIVQDLLDKHLFILMKFEGVPCWKIRPREEAAKLRKLNADERLIYHHIEQSKANGIWSKALRARTKVTQHVLNKTLKLLENKELVQMVLSVKFPNRKMYLLKHLRPSEDIAGGPWQSEGQYDIALIHAVAGLIETFIRKETCVEVPADYNNYQALDRSSAIEEKKAQVHAIQDIEDPPAVRAYHPPRDSASPKIVARHDVKHPTAASLRQRVMESGAIKNKEIRDSDMEQLLEMMVLEGRLEKVSGTNYKLASRATNTAGLNGFVDAPCGTCPVFDLCGDTGEISARTCVYFGEWLATDS